MGDETQGRQKPPWGWNRYLFCLNKSQGLKVHSEKIISRTPEKRILKSRELRGGRGWLEPLMLEHRL